MEHKHNNGFTIIEVVLVLAIAGLIFLAVFLALPAIQRSLRDQARKDAVAKTISMIQAYRSNGGRELRYGSAHDSYIFTRRDGGWFTNGQDYAGIESYLDGQNFPAEIERVSIFTRGSAPPFVRHPRRSVYDEFVGRLQIVLRGSCDISSAHGEAFYPSRDSRNTSIVAIHLEGGDWYCEEFY
ncbi:MAG: type II secretion system protein [bacterium]|nr:type II secretion system protein [bacterium]